MATERMKTVRYEWDVEVVADDGTDDPDIIDHLFQDSYRAAVAVASRLETGTTGRIVLVCDLGDEWEGLRDRGWAYVVGGKLPEWFTQDSEGRERLRRVPQRFHAEVE